MADYVITDPFDEALNKRLNEAIERDFKALHKPSEERPQATVVCDLSPETERDTMEARLEEARRVERRAIIEELQRMAAQAWRSYEAKESLQDAIDFIRERGADAL